MEKARTKATALRKSGRGRRLSRNRETILAVAAERFLSKGYAAATTRGICEDARVTKPTLYHYVKSKRHLFYLLHEGIIERDLEPFIEKASAVDDPMERLRCIMEGYVRIICLHPELRVLIHESLGMKDSYFKEVRLTWKRHYRLLRDTVAELQKRGLIHNTAKSSRLALLLLGMVNWITFWFDYSRKGEAGEVALTAMELALRGLGVRGGFVAA